MMADLLNGWPEDGEPEGYDSEIENWEEEYGKRAQRYYDKKVARAEHAGCVGILLGSAAISLYWFWLLIGWLFL
jgi:hypothetical protein